VTTESPDPDGWSFNTELPSTNGGVALRFGEAGLAVFPCGPDKRPLCQWRLESTTDSTAIARSWERHPQALVGLDLAKSRLIAIDPDRKPGAPDGVAALRDITNIEALGCPITRTPGGGLHLIFRQRDDEALGNTCGALPKGIDVRGAGGYIIAPGSTRQDGTGWQPMPGAPDICDLAAIPFIPDQLHRLITSAKPAKGAGPCPEVAPASALSASISRAVAPQTATLPPVLGNDFFQAVNKAALAQIKEWAPALFPDGRSYLSTGAWRISSQSLGRELEEDISIAPSGIWDFGLEKPYTAIDLVIDHGEATSAVQSAHWLCEQMGIDPGSLGWRGTSELLHTLSDVEAATREGGGDAPTERSDDPSDPLADFMFDDAAPTKPPRMLVKSIIPFEGIAFIGGQSGAGKTFIAIDLAVSLASGEPFFGQKVNEPVGVVILAAEGGGTVASRVCVAREHKTNVVSLPIAWLSGVPDLAKPKEVAALIERLRAVGDRFQAEHDVRLGAVIIDTLAAAFSIEDENSNAEAAKALRLMNAMAKALGVVVMPVHHYGKGVETGLRGASAWRAGADAVLSVSADRDQTTGYCQNRRIALTKSRVGEEGWSMEFDLTFVPLGEDDDKEPYGACYVQPVGGSEAKLARIVSEKKNKVPKTARAFLTAIETALAEGGKKIRPFGHDGPEVIAVDRDDIRKEFNPSYPVDGDTDDKTKHDTRRKAFERGEDWALGNSHIGTRETNGRQMVWLIKGIGQ
jgi:hypothetical protein